MDSAPSESVVMELAQREAFRLGHGYVGTEHQLLALLLVEDVAVLRFIESCGATPTAIRDALLGALPAAASRRLSLDSPLPRTSRQSAS